MALPTRHILAGFPPTISPASHAVEADGWVHLTGQLGRDLDNPAAPLPADVAAQTRQAVPISPAAWPPLASGLSM